MTLTEGQEKWTRSHAGAGLNSTQTFGLRSIILMSINLIIWIPQGHWWLLPLCDVKGTVSAHSSGSCLCTASMAWTIIISTLTPPIDGHCSWKPSEKKCLRKHGMIWALRRNMYVGLSIDHIAPAEGRSWSEDLLYHWGTMKRVGLFRGPGSSHTSYRSGVMLRMWQGNRSSG